jgi:putative ABC transport system substrate-binding protein
MLVGAGMGATWLIGCDDQSSANFPLIGIVQFATTANLEAVRTGLLKGLNLLGIRDGGNVRITVVNGNGDATQTANLMTNMATQNPRLIVAIGSPSANAADSVRAQIPIVFCGVVDAVLANIAVSSTQGKPNATGVTFPYDVENGLKLAKEIVPTATKFGSLIDPTEAFAPGLLASAQTAATANAVTFTSVNIASPADIVAGVQNLKAQGVQVVLQLPSNTAGQGVPNIVSECKNQGMPLFGLQTVLVAQGLIGALGPDPEQTGVQAAEMVKRVLQGVSADTIPIQTTQNLTTVVNKTAAANFGVTLPATVLNRADTVLP